MVENTPLEWQGEDNTIDIIGLDENGVPTPGDTLFDVLTSDGAGGTLFGLTQNLISYYDFEAGNLNPNATSYTQSYYDFVGAESVTTLDQITGIGAAVNGDRTSLFIHYGTTLVVNIMVTQKKITRSFVLQVWLQPTQKTMQFSLVLNMNSEIIGIMVFPLLVYGR